MSEKHVNSEDQINFSGLKNFVFGTLQEFFRFVTFTEAVVRKKILFILAGFVVGVLIAVFYYTNKPKVYKSSSVVIFNRLTKKTYGDILDQLNLLVTSGAEGSAAAELRIPQEAASSLMFVEGKNLNNEPLQNDTSSKVFQPFKINIGLSNTSYADTIESALLNYLNDRPYLKKIGEVERQNNIARLKQIELDLAKLDTLKSEFNKFLASSKVSATFYNNAINPAEIYIQTTQLVSQRENVLRALNVENNAVSLIDGFKVTKTPQARSLTSLILILGSVGLLSGFLLGLVIETKNYVSPRSK